MSIDVLSGMGKIPMVVGDMAEIAEVMGLGFDEHDNTYLIMAHADGDTQKVWLSPEASQNFSTAKQVLVLALSPADQILSGRRLWLGDGGGKVDVLSKAEIEELTLHWKPRVLH